MRRIRFTVQLKILSITVLIVSALLAFVIVVHGRIHSLQQATNSITQQDREMTNLTNQLEKIYWTWRRDSGGMLSPGKTNIWRLTGRDRLPWTAITTNWLR